MSDRVAAVRIFLLRHGRAEAGGADPALSPEGAAGVRACLQDPLLAGVRIDLLVHSPLRRARETAALCAEALSVDRCVETDALLPEAVPAASGKALCRRVETLPAVASHPTVLVVAHLPLLPGLGRWLADDALPFDPGSGWLLEADELWQGTARVVARLPAGDGSPDDGSSDNDGTGLTGVQR